MPAVEFPLIDPVLEAFTTKNGWIGLLLGLGGRETIRWIRTLLRTLRDWQSGGGPDTEQS